MFDEFELRVSDVISDTFWIGFRESYCFNDRTIRNITYEEDRELELNFDDEEFLPDLLSSGEKGSPIPPKSLRKSIGGV